MPGPPGSAGMGLGRSLALAATLSGPGLQGSSGCRKGPPSPPWLPDSLRPTPIYLLLVCFYYSVTNTQEIRRPSYSVLSDR